MNIALVWRKRPVLRGGWTRDGSGMPYFRPWNSAAYIPRPEVGHNSGQPGAARGDSCSRALCGGGQKNRTIEPPA